MLPIYAHFDPILFGGRVGNRCSMLAWTVISVVTDCLITQRLHKNNCTININLVVLECAWLLGNNRKMQNGQIQA